MPVVQQNIQKVMHFFSVVANKGHVLYSMNGNSRCMVKWHIGLEVINQPLLWYAKCRALEISAQDTMSVGPKVRYFDLH